MRFYEATLPPLQPIGVGVTSRTLAYTVSGRTTTVPVVYVTDATNQTAIQVGDILVACNGQPLVNIAACEDDAAHDDAVIDILGAHASQRRVILFLRCASECHNERVNATIVTCLPEEAALLFDPHHTSEHPELEECDEPLLAATVARPAASVPREHPDALDDDDVARETAQLMDELRKAEEEDLQLIEREVQRQLSTLASLDRPATIRPALPPPPLPLPSSSMSSSTSSPSSTRATRRAQARRRELEDERKELLRLREEVEHQRRTMHGQYPPQILVLPPPPPQSQVSPPAVFAPMAPTLPAATIAPVISMAPAAPEASVAPAAPMAPTAPMALMAPVVPDVEAIIRRSMAEIEAKLSASVAQLRAEKTPTAEDTARVAREKKELDDRLLAMERGTRAHAAEVSVQILAGQEAAKEAAAAAGAMSVAEAVDRRLADVERLIADLLQPKPGDHIETTTSAAVAADDEAVAARLLEVERRVVGEVQNAQRAAAAAAEEARRVAALLAEKERRVEEERARQAHVQAQAQAQDAAARQSQWRAEQALLKEFLQAQEAAHLAELEARRTTDALKMQEELLAVETDRRAVEEEKQRIEEEKRRALADIEKRTQLALVALEAEREKAAKEALAREAELMVLEARAQLAQAAKVRAIEEARLAEATAAAERATAGGKAATAATAAKAAEAAAEARDAREREQSDRIDAEVRRRVAAARQREGDDSKSVADRQHATQERRRQEALRRRQRIDDEVRRRVEQQKAAILAARSSTAATATATAIAAAAPAPAPRQRSRPTAGKETETSLAAQKAGAAGPRRPTEEEEVEAILAARKAAAAAAMAGQRRPTEEEEVEALLAARKAAAVAAAARTRSTEQPVSGVDRARPDAATWRAVERTVDTRDTDAAAMSIIIDLSAPGQLPPAPTQPMRPLPAPAPAGSHHTGGWDVLPPPTGHRAPVPAPVPAADAAAGGLVPVTSFDAPLGATETPSGMLAFDYVSRGAQVGITLGPMTVYAATGEQLVACAAIGVDGAVTRDEINRGDVLIALDDAPLFVPMGETFSPSTADEHLSHVTRLILEAPRPRRLRLVRSPRMRPSATQMHLSADEFEWFAHLGAPPGEMFDIALTPGGPPGIEVAPYALEWVTPRGDVVTVYLPIVLSSQVVPTVAIGDCLLALNGERLHVDSTRVGAAMALQHVAGVRNQLINTAHRLCRFMRRPDVVKPSGTKTVLSKRHIAQFQYLFFNNGGGGGNNTA